MSNIEPIEQFGYSKSQSGLHQRIKETITGVVLGSKSRETSGHKYAPLPPAPYMLLFYFFALVWP